MELTKINNSFDFANRILNDTFNKKNLDPSQKLIRINESADEIINIHNNYGIEFFDSTNDLKALSVVACMPVITNIINSKNQDYQTARRVNDNFIDIAKDISQSELIKSMDSNKIGGLSEFAAIACIYGAIENGFISHLSWALPTDSKNDSSDPSEVTKSGYDFRVSLGPINNPRINSSDLKDIIKLQVKTTDHLNNRNSYDKSITILPLERIYFKVTEEKYRRKIPSKIIKAIANQQEFMLKIYEKLANFLYKDEIE